jgi:hypothetical protein
LGRLFQLRFSTHKFSDRRLTAERRSNAAGQLFCNHRNVALIENRRTLTCYVVKFRDHLSRPRSSRILGVFLQVALAAAIVTNKRTASVFFDALSTLAHCTLTNFDEG